MVTKVQRRVFATVQLPLHFTTHYGHSLYADQRLKCSGCGRPRRELEVTVSATLPTSGQ